MLNTKTQYYRGVPLVCIKRNYYGYKAMRFAINGTNQNLWIPIVYLEKDGTIKAGVELGWLLKRNQNQLKYAGLKAYWTRGTFWYK